MSKKPITTDKAGIPQWMKSFRTTALREKRYTKYLREVEKTHRDDNPFSSEQLRAYIATHGESPRSGVDGHLVSFYAEREPKWPIFCRCGFTFVATPDTDSGSPDGPFVCQKCRRRHFMPGKEKP